MEFCPVPEVYITLLTNVLINNSLRRYIRSRECANPPERPARHPLGEPRHTRGRRGRPPSSPAPAVASAFFSGVFVEPVFPGEPCLTGWKSPVRGCGPIGGCRAGGARHGRASLRKEGLASGPSCRSTFHPLWSLPGHAGQRVLQIRFWDRAGAASCWRGMLFLGDPFPEGARRGLAGHSLPLGSPSSSPWPGLLSSLVGLAAP